MDSSKGMPKTVSKKVRDTTCETHGYAEASRNTIFTTKGMKRTKMADQIARFFLGDLRVLRGASSNDRFELELQR